MYILHSSNVWCKMKLKLGLHNLHLPFHALVLKLKTCNIFKKKLWQKNIFGNTTGHTKLVTEVFAISYTSFNIETLYKLQNENKTALQK